MSLGTFTEDSSGGHGMAVASTNATWSTVRNAANASSVQTSDAVDNPRANFSGGNYDINRYFFAFDTSQINGGQVLSGTLNLTADATIDNTDSTHLVVVQGSQADPPTALQTSDYSKINFSSGGSIALSSISSNTAFSIPLDTTGLTYINNIGWTKLAVIIGRDLNNSAPTGANRVDMRTVNNGTAIYRPNLVLNFNSGGGLDLTSKTW